MRWKTETRDELIARINQQRKEWHRVFAWRPRYDRENGYKMWLEFCLCKSRDEDGSAPWLYRPITLLEKDVNPSGDY